MQHAKAFGGVSESFPEGITRHPKKNCRTYCTLKYGHISTRLPAPPRWEVVVPVHTLCATVDQREGVRPLREAQLEVERRRGLQHLVRGGLLVLRARPNPLRPAIRRQRLLLLLESLGCLRHRSCRRCRRCRLLCLRLRLHLLLSERERGDARELREVQRVAARRVGEREVPKAQRVCDLVRVRVRV